MGALHSPGCSLHPGRDGASPDDVPLLVGQPDVHARSKSRPLLARIARLAKSLGGYPLFFLAARLVYRLQSEGEDYIPSVGPCLFACNHQSEMADALVYITITRRRPHVYMFGWHNLRDEHPMLDFLQNYGEGNLRERYLRAYWGRGLSAGELLRAHSVLQQGGAIYVTVEGEWTWDGRLQYPLAPGAAWLALRTGAPVIPVVSIGGYDVQPRWDLDTMRLSGRITVRVGAPLLFTTESDTEESLAAANERIWQAMAALLPPHMTIRGSGGI